MLVSRSRQRAAIAALLAAVPGLSAETAFAYEQDPQTPSLRGLTYAEVGFGMLKETPYNTAYRKQGRTWWIHLVAWTATGLITGDNAGRTALLSAFDSLLDAVEDAVRSHMQLTDGSGKVAYKFGAEFTTLEGAAEFNGDGSRLEAWIFPEGWLIQ